MYNKIIKPIILPFWIMDILIAVPRVVCGYLLTSDFGASKFGMPWSPVDKNLHLFEVIYWFPTDVAEYGGVFALFPIFFAWMGAFSEAVGGLFLLIGFQTRISSFLICCTMLVAIFMEQMGNGTWNILPAAGFLWVGIYHMVIGSGRIGLDYLISKRMNK